MDERGQAEKKGGEAKLFFFFKSHSHKLAARYYGNVSMYEVHTIYISP